MKILKSGDPVKIDELKKSCEIKEANIRSGTLLVCWHNKEVKCKWCGCRMLLDPNDSAKIMDDFARGDCHLLRCHDCGYVIYINCKCTL